jgi:HemK-related putative methylase
MKFYEPREDSLLLQKYVKKYAQGTVLDMGTGSGIQAKTAAARKVMAADINPDCKKCFAGTKIRFVQSDLFAKVKGKFDTIIFNPPYLPEDLRVRDLTVDGGKKGYEIIERFLNKVNNHLKPRGIVLMVFSSLTNQTRVEELIANNMLEHEALEKSHIFFEDLYVYLIRKSELLRRLEKREIKDVKYLARGKRGVVFTGTFKGRRLAIKTKRQDSKAVGRLENEARFLRILNKRGIGPKLKMTGKGFLAYEFVEGDFFLDYASGAGRAAIQSILKSIFNQLYVMDRLGVNKEEMSHPRKHIIVRNGKAVLIDFERCHYAKSPSNVTQFCSFLMTPQVYSLLYEKGIRFEPKKLIKLAQDYKGNLDKSKILSIIEEAR